MLIENLLSALANDFKKMNIDDEQSNFALYKSERLKKFVVTKSYFSENSFSDWKNDDYEELRKIYETLERKYRYNFYYLIILDIDETLSEETYLTISEFEKDEYICKKLVIKSILDIKRLPFLNNEEKEISSNLLDFNETFIELLNKNLEIPKNIKEEFFKELPTCE